MKRKALIGLIATTTIGTSIATSAIMSNQNITQNVNKVLMVNDTSNLSTNEAVVIKGNSSMNLYALSNGTGIVSNLSTGEMLTILGHPQNGYCKVKVQETGAVGYINTVNMQNILNGTNDSFTQLSGNGQVVNVSSNIRLRSNPSIGNNIIGHLTNGTSLNIIGKQGQWYKVSVNGQVGFIYEEYVSTSITNNSISANSNSSSTSVNNSSRSNSTNTTNLDNPNTLTASSKSSNFSSTTNSRNHTKNIVVTTKSSVTSNSLQDKNNTNINNIIENNIVYTNPQQITFIQKAATSSSPSLQVIKNKVIKLKVLEKLYGTAPGAQNSTPIWYKVESQNGIIGYIAQNETYYKIIYTSPNKNIPVFEAPDTSTLIIDSINHKKEPLYVISNITTTNPMKTRYYKVRTINGKVGFICEEHISTNNSNISINSSKSQSVITSKNEGSNIISHSNSKNINASNQNKKISNSSSNSSLKINSRTKDSNNAKIIKNETPGNYLATVNKLCYIVPKPGMVLSQAKMNSSKYINSKLIPNGEQISVSKNTSNLPKGWVQVTAPDGVTGYLPASDLNVANTSEANNTNIIKFTNFESGSNGKGTWTNVNIIPNNMVGKTVNTNPNTSCELFSISPSAGKVLETFNKKSVSLKVLGQVVERAHGTKNNIIWYKVKAPNGLVGYVNQSLTYSALCYTNPDYKVNILNAPYTTGSVLKTISYKEEPIYVINQVIGISPKTNKKEYYFEVSYDNRFTGFINIHDLLSSN